MKVYRGHCVSGDGEKQQWNVSARTAVEALVVIALAMPRGWSVARIYRRSSEGWKRMSLKGITALSNSKRRTRHGKASNRGRAKERLRA